MGVCVCAFLTGQATQGLHNQIIACTCNDRFKPTARSNVEGVCHKPVNWLQCQSSGCCVTHCSAPRRRSFERKCLQNVWHLPRWVWFFLPRVQVIVCNACVLVVVSMCLTIHSWGVLKIQARWKEENPHARPDSGTICIELAASWCLHSERGAHGSKIYINIYIYNTHIFCFSLWNRL